MRSIICSLLWGVKFRQAEDENIQNCVHTPNYQFKSNSLWKYPCRLIYKNETTVQISTIRSEHLLRYILFRVLNLFRYTRI